MTSRCVSLLSYCFVCLWTSCLLHPIRDLTYTRHTSTIEYLVDGFVHPLNEWPAIPIISCEDRLKFVSSLQLVSRAAYCIGLPSKCYPEVTGPRWLVVRERESRPTYRTLPSHRPTLLDVNWSKNHAPLTGSQSSLPTSHILSRRNRSVSSSNSWHNCGIDDIERVVLVR